MERTVYVIGILREFLESEFEWELFMGKTERINKLLSEWEAWYGNI